MKAAILAAVPKALRAQVLGVGRRAHAGGLRRRKGGVAGTEWRRVPGGEVDRARLADSTRSWAFKVVVGLAGSGERLLGSTAGKGFPRTVGLFVVGRIDEAGLSALNGIWIITPRALPWAGMRPGLWPSGEGEGGRGS
jgi:hypothetical protein